jgi:hypothetical protein
MLLYYSKLLFFFFLVLSFYFVILQLGLCNQVKKREEKKSKMSSKETYQRRWLETIYQKKKESKMITYSTKISTFFILIFSSSFSCTFCWHIIEKWTTYNDKRRRKWAMLYTSFHYVIDVYLTTIHHNKKKNSSTVQYKRIKI